MTRPSTATTMPATLPVPQQTNPATTDAAAPDDRSSAAPAAADAAAKAPARSATTPPRGTIKLKRLSAARYP